MEQQQSSQIENKKSYFTQMNQRLLSTNNYNHNNNYISKDQQIMNPQDYVQIQNQVYKQGYPIITRTTIRVGYNKAQQQFINSNQQHSSNIAQMHNNRVQNCSRRIQTLRLNNDKQLVSMFELSGEIRKYLNGIYKSGQQIDNDVFDMEIIQSQIHRFEEAKNKIKNKYANGDNELTIRVINNLLTILHKNRQQIQVLKQLYRNQQHTNLIQNIRKLKKRLFVDVDDNQQTQLLLDRILQNLESRQKSMKNFSNKNNIQDTLQRQQKVNNMNKQQIIQQTKHPNFLAQGLIKTLEEDNSRLQSQSKQINQQLKRLQYQNKRYQQIQSIIQQRNYALEIQNSRLLQLLQQKQGQIVVEAILEDGIVFNKGSQTNQDSQLRLIAGQYVMSNRNRKNSELSRSHHSQYSSPLHLNQQYSDRQVLQRNQVIKAYQQYQQINMLKNRINWLQNQLQSIKIQYDNKQQQYNQLLKQNNDNYALGMMKMCKGQTDISQNKQSQIKCTKQNIEQQQIDKCQQQVLRYNIIGIQQHNNKLQQQNKQQNIKYNNKQNNKQKISQQLLQKLSQTNIDRQAYPLIQLIYKDIQNQFSVDIAKLQLQLYQKTIQIEELTRKCGQLSILKDQKQQQQQQQQQQYRNIESLQLQLKRYQKSYSQLSDRNHKLLLQNQNILSELQKYRNQHIKHNSSNLSNNQDFIHQININRIQSQQSQQKLLDNIISQKHYQIQLLQSQINNLSSKLQSLKQQQQNNKQNSNNLLKIKSTDHIFDDIIQDITDDLWKMKSHIGLYHNFDDLSAQQLADVISNQSLLGAQFNKNNRQEYQISQVSPFHQSYCQFHFNQQRFLKNKYNSANNQHNQHNSHNQKNSITQIQQGNESLQQKIGKISSIIKQNNNALSRSYQKRNQLFIKLIQIYDEIVNELQKYQSQTHNKNELKQAPTYTHTSIINRIHQIVKQPYNIKQKLAEIVQNTQKHDKSQNALNYQNRITMNSNMADFNSYFEGIKKNMRKYSLRAAGFHNYPEQFKCFNPITAASQQTHTDNSQTEYLMNKINYLQNQLQQVRKLQQSHTQSQKSQNHEINRYKKRQLILQQTIKQLNQKLEGRKKIIQNLQKQMKEQQMSKKQRQQKLLGELDQCKKQFSKILSLKQQEIEVVRRQLEQTNRLLNVKNTINTNQKQNQNQNQKQNVENEQIVQNNNNKSSLLQKFKKKIGITSNIINDQQQYKPKQSQNEDQQLQLLKKINKQVSTLVRINRRLQTKLNYLQNHHHLNTQCLSMIDFFILLQSKMQVLLDWLKNTHFIQQNDYYIQTQYEQFISTNNQLLISAQFQQYMQNWVIFMKQVCTLLYQCPVQQQTSIQQKIQQ